mgnify:CR=1 FL=1
MGDAWRLLQDLQKLAPRKMCHTTLQATWATHASPLPPMGAGRAVKAARRIGARCCAVMRGVQRWWRGSARCVGAARGITAVRLYGGTMHWCCVRRHGGLPTMDCCAAATRCAATCCACGACLRAVAVASPRRHDVARLGHALAGDMGDACVAHARRCGPAAPVASACRCASPNPGWNRRPARLACFLCPAPRGCAERLGHLPLQHLLKHLLQQCPHQVLVVADSRCQQRQLPPTLLCGQGLSSFWFPADLLSLDPIP